MPKSKSKNSIKLKSKITKSTKRSSFDVTRIRHHHLYSFLVFAFGVILFFQTLSVNVRAQNVGNYDFPNPVKYDTLEDVLNALLGLVRVAFTITFLAMVLYGAYMWIRSEGDSEKVKKARNIIIAAAIGFAIAVFAPTIVTFIGSLLQVKLLSK